MRLNTKKVQEIMLQKGLAEEDICIQTGLDKHSVRWIFDNGFASEEAMERIASVVGAEAGAILLPEITGGHRERYRVLQGQREGDGDIHAGAV